MKLHLNNQLFIQIINEVKEETGIASALIEKDYYVTLFLKELVDKVPNLIFKGGTSLSKCHKLIDRFSEDIDISLEDGFQSQSYRKRLKNTIKEICNSNNLNLLNEEETRSRRDYNCYKIDYNSIFSNPGLNPVLLLETVFIISSFPCEIKECSSLIYEYLVNKNQLNIIEEYQLNPYTIKVQTLERTFIDKVFAICDYMIGGIKSRHSRHIYDLYKIYPHIKLDNNFRKLFLEIKMLRKEKKSCYSAQDDVYINELLKQIIEDEYYKKDYNEVTKLLINKPINYNEVISVILKS